MLYPLPHCNVLTRLFQPSGRDGFHLSQFTFFVALTREALDPHTQDRMLFGRFGRCCGEQGFDPVLFSLELPPELLLGPPQVLATVQGLVDGEGGTVDVAVPQGLVEDVGRDVVRLGRLAPPFNLRHLNLVT